MILCKQGLRNCYYGPKQRLTRLGIQILFIYIYIYIYIIISEYTLPNRDVSNGHLPYRSVHRLA